MKTFFGIFFISGLLVSITSCKKDNKSGSGCSLSESNLQGTYKYGSVTYKATPTSAATDASSMVDACSLDDIITFGANHIFTYTDAGIKCDPSDEGTGTWSLQGNVLTAGAQSGPVDNFTCTGFIIVHADFINTGDTLLIGFGRQ